MIPKQALIQFITVWSSHQ